jgi:hypothetical protein
MVEEAVAIVLLAVGIPSSLARLWWIWWQSDCHGCGLEHRVCECPAEGPTMRPRR